MPFLNFVTRMSKKCISFKASSRQLSSLTYQHQSINGIFPEIFNDLCVILHGYKVKELSPQLATVLEYNLRNSKNSICWLTVLSYENLVEPVTLTAENMRLAYVLGWCSEILNTALLMLDDIINNSTMRRGQPCWYTLKSMGENAISDILLMATSVLVLLEKKFKHLDCYPAIMELFHEVLFRKACGQSMDIERAKKPVTSFNSDSYRNLAINKATYENLYLPFAASAQLAGFTDEEALRQIREVILEIGLIFQIQTDFLDCFGTLDTTGEIGTDIQNNKYSWLAVVCMERATEKQKQIMIECYGKKDPAKVQKVKELYTALDLPKQFEVHLDESYHKAKLLIEKLSPAIPSDLFLQVLNKICSRKF